MLKNWFSNFRELSKEERYIIDQMSEKFRQKEYEYLKKIRTLPCDHILRYTSIESNVYHKQLLRNSYDIFSKDYGKRFARKIARELIEEDGMGFV